jgi:hypothetical protein
MRDVLDQAQNFTGAPVAAGRKRESWLRKAPNTSAEETAAQYREAAADLAERYPDIEPGQTEGFAAGMAPALVAPSARDAPAGVGLSEARVSVRVDRRQRVGLCRRFEPLATCGRCQRYRCGNVAGGG